MENSDFNAAAGSCSKVGVKHPHLEFLTRLLRFTPRHKFFKPGRNQLFLGGFGLALRSVRGSPIRIRLSALHHSIVLGSALQMLPLQAHAAGFLDVLNARRCRRCLRRSGSHIKDNNGSDGKKNGFDFQHFDLQ